MSIKDLEKQLRNSEQNRRGGKLPEDLEIELETTEHLRRETEQRVLRILGLLPEPKLQPEPEVTTETVEGNEVALLTHTLNQLTDLSGTVQTVTEQLTDQSGQMSNSRQLLQTLNKQFTGLKQILIDELEERRKMREIEKGVLLDLKDYLAKWK